VKKSAVAAAAVIAIVGLGVAAVPLAEEYSARQIKAGVELDGSTTVDSVEVAFFGRRITMHNLHVRNVGDVTIGRWEASGLSWPLGELLRGRTPLSGLRLGDPLQAGHLELGNLNIVDNGATWSIGSLAIDGFDLERYDTTGIGPLQFSTLAARIAAALSIRKFEQKQTVYAAPGSADRTTIAAFTVERFACPNDSVPGPLIETDVTPDPNCDGGILRGFVTEVAPERTAFRLMATWVIAPVVDPPLEIKVGARLDVHVHQGPGPLGWVADSIALWNGPQDEIQGRVDGIDVAPDGTVRLRVLDTWITVPNIKG